MLRPAQEWHYIHSGNGHEVKLFSAGQHSILTRVMGFKHQRTVYKSQSPLCSPPIWIGRNPQFRTQKMPAAEGRATPAQPRWSEHCRTGTVTEGAAGGCLPRYLCLKSEGPIASYSRRSPAPFQVVQKDKDYTPHCQKTAINIKLSQLTLVLFFLDHAMESLQQ